MRVGTEPLVRAARKLLQKTNLLSLRVRIDVHDGIIVLAVLGDVDECLACRCFEHPRTAATGMLRDRLILRRQSAGTCDRRLTIASRERRCNDERCERHLFMDLPQANRDGNGLIEAFRDGGH